jgi:diguanylate cyclase (GGDEF)-like protein
VIIRDYRSSFTVFVLDSDLQRGRPTTDDLANAGYLAQQILSLASLNEQIKTNPPHIVLLRYGDPIFSPEHRKTEEVVQNLLLTLPELHAVVLASEGDLAAACELYDHGVYDVIEVPVYPARQLLQALDRAATTDYYMYLNEQLKEQNQPANGHSFEVFELYCQQIAKSDSEIGAVKLTLTEVQRLSGAHQVMYMKFVRARATLVAEASTGPDPEAVSSVGIDLKKTEPRFHERLLQKPERLVGLVDLMRTGFRQRQFAAFPVSIDGRCEGLVVALLAERDSSLVQNDSRVRAAVEVLAMQLGKVAAQRRLEKLSIYDEATETFHREFLLKKLREEVTRARRILRPVCLIVAQIDGYKDLALRLEPYEVERLTKAIAGVVLKNSRLTDLVGRLTSDQLGVVLPHTDRKGGAIKAERLRRVIESINFSTIHEDLKSVTISLGVSEYPGASHDAPQLLQSADSALYEVIRAGKNKVCVASPPPNFEPDFAPIKVV